MYLYLFLLIDVAYDVISWYRLATLREYILRDILCSDIEHLCLIEVLAHGEVLLSFLDHLACATYEGYVLTPTSESLTLFLSLRTIEDIVDILLAEHYVTLGDGYK